MSALTCSVPRSAASSRAATATCTLGRSGPRSRRPPKVAASRSHTTRAAAPTFIPATRAPSHIANTSSLAMTDAALPTATSERSRAMDAYIFAGELYCAKCGREAQGFYSVRRDSEDSDDYPQGPYPDGGGEADCPQHCGECGVFLENPLTDEGYAYVRDMVRDMGNDPYNAEMMAEWVSFYRIELALDAETCEAGYPIKQDEASPRCGAQSTEDCKG